MTAFLIIGAVGILFLLASIVLGDVFDGVFEGIGGDIFSGAAVAGFLGAFGFSGALVLSALPDQLIVAIIVGLVVGLAVGAGVGWITLKLRNTGGEHNVNTATLVDSTGTVISDIPAEGYGEVSLVAAGHITKLNARSSVPLSAGTPVKVTAVLSATSIMVAPLEP
ncbi:NfeD family protein [Propionibacteriaceae bacterium Y2011]|uniref:NfeD family protein n=1 Tax=Microlunatus sp. Y2014 TaxID=3418488 RepID=UPI003B4635EA